MLDHIHCQSIMTRGRMSSMEPHDHPPSEVSPSSQLTRCFPPRPFSRSPQTGKFTPYLASLSVGDKISFKVRSFPLFDTRSASQLSQTTLTPRPLYSSRDLSPSSSTPRPSLSRDSPSPVGPVSPPCGSSSTTRSTFVPHCPRLLHPAQQPDTLTTQFIPTG